MDEDLSIINSNTRNEKIKNFIINNKKSLIILLILFLGIIISFFGYKEFKKSQTIKISDYYNSIIINYSDETKDETINKLVEIINKKNSTYSPLSLYFIIDNQLISNHGEVNDLFDILIDDTPLEKEIKNLIIYKKGLYNADKAKENELLEILRPLINTKSVWSSHALYLIAEFFYSKDEKQKAKDFFNKILETDKANQDIIKETRKRLSRDLSD
jgi:predicted negative regulator of RcsB-dependent stress response